MSLKASISVSRFAILAVAAAVVNVVVFFIGQAAHASYSVGSPAPINAVMVAIATIAPLAVGAFVAHLVGRRGSKALKILAWVGFGFAVISSPNGWVLSHDTATGLTLGAMHLIAAFAWLLAVKPGKAA